MNSVGLYPECLATPVPYAIITSNESKVFSLFQKKVLSPFLNGVKSNLSVIGKVVYEKKRSNRRIREISSIGGLTYSICCCSYSYVRLSLLLPSFSSLCCSGRPIYWHMFVIKRLCGSQRIVGLASFRS